MNSKILNVFVASCLSISLFAAKPNSNIPKDYKGKAFQDDYHTAGPQLIPGKVQCAFFDLGGEGIAYHDTDSLNNGSGPYNHQTGHCEPGAEYVAYFRINEGVDLSYTKQMLDFSHPNPVTPDHWQQYIGWTYDNEYCNYTVNVAKAGTYQVGILYSNNAPKFKLLINHVFAGEYVGGEKTNSYHTWNKVDSIGTVTFKKKGLNLLTFQYSGGSNYAFLEFKSK